MLRLSFAWDSMASTVPICFLHLGGKVRVLPNMSTPKMSTPSMSTFKMSTPRTSTSQNVNSPKISYFAKIHCVSYFTTCQTAPQAGNFDHYQAHFHYILCGTWDGVTQELEKMDNLDDFKTYLRSYRYDDSNHYYFETITLTMTRTTILSHLYRKLAQ